MTKRYNGAEPSLHEFIPNVKVCQNAIDEDLAARVHKGIESLIEREKKELLPFVEQINSFIWHVNMYCGSESMDQYPGDMYRYRSFVKAVGVLGKLAGISQVEWVGIADNPNTHRLELHQDAFNGGRGLLTVSGCRIIQFPHPVLNLAYSSIMQLEGDYYHMTFRDDETSIEHAVNIVDSGFSVWINT